MKKILFTLLAVLMVCGCSKDNDSTVVDSDLIASYEPDRATNDIKTFFSSELPLVRDYHPSLEGGNQRPDIYAQKWDVNLQTDTCLLINSAEQFQKLYHGEKEIPNIDFDKQTLLIGWKTYCDVSSLSKLELLKGQDNVNLHVTCDRYKESLYNNLTMMLDYWGIFPKISEAPSTVTTSIEWIDKP